MKIAKPATEARIPRRIGSIRIAPECPDQRQIDEADQAVQIEGEHSIEHHYRECLSARQEVAEEEPGGRFAEAGAARRRRDVEERLIDDGDGKYLEPRARPEGRRERDQDTDEAAVIHGVAEEDE